MISLRNDSTDQVTVLRRLYKTISIVIRSECLQSFLLIPLDELTKLIEAIKYENRHEEIENTLDDYLRVIVETGLGEDAIIGMIKHFAAPTYRKVWEVSKFDVQVVMLGVSIECWLNAFLSKYNDRQKEQWLSKRDVQGYPEWQKYVQSKVEVYGITTEQSTHAESDSRESPAPTADSKGTGESKESTPSILTLSLKSRSTN